MKRKHIRAQGCGRTTGRLTQGLFTSAILTAGICTCLILNAGCASQQERAGGGSDPQPPTHSQALSVDAFDAETTVAPEVPAPTRTPSTSRITAVPVVQALSAMPDDDSGHWLG